MLLASWNVNSIRARHERFLAWLFARQPDVLCLQELKATEELLSFRKNDGLRLDLILATSAVARACTAASIDRIERKGQQPSDHAPVLATFDLP